MLIPGKKLAVFSIKSSDRKSTIWTRVGTAYVNKDESLNVWLDALPLDGKLHCRDAVPDRPPAAAPAVDGAGAAPAPALAAVGGAQ